MAASRDTTTHAIEYTDGDRKKEENKESTTVILKRIEDDRHFQLFVKSLQTEATEKRYDTLLQPIPNSTASNQQQR